MTTRQEIIKELDTINNTLANIVDAYGLIWDYISQQPQAFDALLQHEGLISVNHLAYDSLKNVADKTDVLFCKLEREEREG